jgi:hypothetical protein
MSIILLKPLDDRIVLWGMSCVGKTTFSQGLNDHQYYCFDAMFQWHLIETLGLSCEANLKHIKQQCSASRFVLDGWHLSDTNGRNMPSGACAYVIYAPYNYIIKQYRVQVDDPNQHLPMFLKWYNEVDYEKLPGVRYFRNSGEFVETNKEDFFKLLSEHNQGIVATSGIQGRSSF